MATMPPVPATIAAKAASTAVVTSCHAAGAAGVAAGVVMMAAEVASIIAVGRSEADRLASMGKVRVNAGFALRSLAADGHVTMECGRPEAAARPGRTVGKASC